jgi:hypothetical protein
VLAAKGEVPLLWERAPVRNGPRSRFRRQGNGELLSLAEGKFDVLITVDKNLRYQQNITNRRIVILVVRSASNDIDDIRPHLPEMLTRLQSLRPGQIVEIGELPQ